MMKMGNDKLDILLSEYFLSPTERRNDFIKYQSEKMVIVISFDERERSGTLWIGKPGGKFVEITEKIAREYLHIDALVNASTMQTFTTNVLHFFQGQGERLLRSDDRSLSELEAFSKRQSELYTLTLLKKQLLDAANNAWNEGNYAEFVRLFKDTDLQDFPESIKEKLRIASKKLKQQ